jgi:4-hydroxy-3-methylbut-2-enyl diphosphate reductase
MLGNRTLADFKTYFGHKCTAGFDPIRDLEHFGVINQTTMLATETEEVMSILKEAALKRFGSAELANHMAETRDTLCYATFENQSATDELAKTDADLAFILGGYNSSNTMHLVEILEKQMPSYHIRDFNELTDLKSIHHYDQWTNQMIKTEDWLPTKRPLTIAITSGASCPDILMDEFIFGLLERLDIEINDLESILDHIGPAVDLAKN